MFVLFLKTGAVLFGSGYVLLAFLRADFVERLGWLTEQQLLDAIAIGQITPGPVFTTATFIGFLLGGPVGSVAATVGIFLPAFVFVALTRPLVHRMRRSPRTAALLDGINAGSLAMMVFVLAHLARSAITDALTLAIAAVSLVAIARFRINTVWLMAGGAAAGWMAGWTDHHVLMCNGARVPRARRATCYVLRARATCDVPVRATCRTDHPPHVRHAGRGSRSPGAWPVPWSTWHEHEARST